MLNKIITCFAFWKCKSKIKANSWTNFRLKPDFAYKKA